MKVVSFPESLRGKWVAYKIEDRLKILDYDDSLDRLLERLKVRGVDLRFIQLDYIPEEEVVFL